MKVHVVPPNLGWPAEFKAEAERIRAALGNRVVAVHHIGSTAIPGIHAKPVIDILLEVDDLAALDARSASAAMVELGYEPKGEFGIPGRRYFRKDSAQGVRTHHVHAFKVGDAGIERHLAFRDYLIAHRAIAESYTVLKQRLADSHPDDVEAYMDGKDAFIKEHEAKAIAWRKEANPSATNNAITCSEI
jgi:GrpB-like predicted nucleotidyltransferase (UPF0157 family)